MPGKQDPKTVPQQSKIKLECQKCGHIWSPRVQTYLSRTSLNGGCRQCFNQNIQNLELYPNTPFVKRDQNVKRSPRRRGKAVLRDLFKKGSYGFIENRNQLLEYLREQSNEHNNYVFKLVLRDTEFPKKRNELLTNQYCLHHVIPLHDKGSPDSWNLIYVTKEEHNKIHRLRYKVDNNPQDQKAIYATSYDFLKSLDSLPSAKQSFRDKQAIKEKKKRKAALARRTPETVKAISEGMCWIHKTGFKMTIEPNSVETIQEIKALLIQSLPNESPDCQRLISNKSSSHTYIREHIHTIFKIENSRTKLKKRRCSVYGFVVSPLKSISKSF
jgi:hypothetical protein